MNYTIPESKNYKQYDTRWASLSYRVKPACMRLNGCGATSLADIIYPIKKVTPKDTRAWLLKKGYVSANQGTYWAGISACMKAYGFERVINHPTMPEFFNEMAKGNRAGVILFRGGSRGGRTYTTGGHFCAIVGYKKVGNKHYLYILDPGPRANNGWICYESEMRGLVVQIWSGKYPDKKKKTTTKKTTTKKKDNKAKSTKNNTNKEKTSKSNTKTETKKTEKKTEAKKAETKKKTVPELAAEWAIKIAKDNSFTYGKGGPANWYHGRPRARQVGCYFCGTTVTGVKRAKKGSKWEKTYCCNSFVMAAYVHGGGLFSKCKGGSTKIDYWCKLEKDGKKIFEKVKNPSVKTLQVGDILANGSHVKMYVGDGKVAHAKRQGWDAGSITVEKIKSLGGYEVARYIYK